MTPTLLGPAVAAATLIIGALIQFGIFSFFMGKMKGAQESLSAQLTAVVGQLAGFQGSMQALQTAAFLHDIGKLAVRMDQVEQNSVGLSGLSARFERQSGVYDVQHAEMTRRMEKVERGADGINRQLDNLMRTRVQPTNIAGLQEIHSE